MKISFRKLPFLFNLIFLIVTILQSLIILVVNPHVTKFIPTYMDAMAEVWWLCIVAILLHIIAYLISLDQNLILFAHLCAIVAYIILILVPNLLLVALTLLVISLALSFHVYQFHYRTPV
ncbi:hypothetical protein [Latilactobacillus graminis]|uniref:Membrane protein n=2 Tax=Latilactobacillus graminis TaxID=60519 RepID=A0AA89I351_9LACO|nr:hypothetical protein [Latilactobacillus graminis]KRM24014.1 membrane protein [Latilactobacillus graminis DSM 20719]QFP79822.1 hypothetical protein LG542_06000 [Latilactobacillus graminis]